MVLQDHHACAAPEIPCLCVQQLLLSNADSHAADRKGDARKMSLLTTRTILKQYHQLAVLRHAERDFAASRNASDVGGCWPANLLPLPVAVIHDIRNALACLL
ncbi:hypothetical protein H4S06_006048 [Coemansia sp. BCRC 34490]|nr:hypothetical protein H4S06_006048 [Coemansia sp. BCRC 34490]